MNTTPLTKLLSATEFPYTIHRLSEGTGIKLYRMSLIHAGTVRPTFEEYALIVNYLGGLARRMTYDELFPAIDNANSTKRGTALRDDRIHREQSHRSQFLATAS